MLIIARRTRSMFPLPLTADLLFDFPQRFDVQSILNPDFTLNEEAWSKAKPLLLTVSITYPLSWDSHPKELLASICNLLWIVLCNTYQCGRSCHSVALG